MRQQHVESFAVAQYIDYPVARSALAGAGDAAGIEKPQRALAVTLRRQISLESEVRVTEERNIRPALACRRRESGERALDPVVVPVTDEYPRRAEIERERFRHSADEHIAVAGHGLIRLAAVLEQRDSLAAAVAEKDKAVGVAAVQLYRSKL